jgi:FG-GAP-like repeat/Secretion system C-terminal sorting domain
MVISTQSVFSQFGQRNVIDSIFGITEIITADLNNDNFKDIIISQKYQNGKIAFYINQGNGAFGGQTTVANIPNARSVAYGDINNDGWEDIISASTSFSTNPDSLFLFINDSGNFPISVLIDTQIAVCDKILKVKTTDIDNDNDIDIIAMADCVLSVFYNDGTGVFTKSNIDPGIITEYYDLALSDIDADGFTDIVVGGTKTLIYKNTNGFIHFDSSRTDFINQQFFNGLVFLTHLNDFDNDGDDDLLISGQNQTDLRWHTNDGDGFFTITQIFETNISQCQSIDSKDFDLDGDVDIFTCFPQTGKVVWYENLGTGNFSSKNIIYTGNIPFTTVVYSDDLNNDGKDDIIWADNLSFHLNDPVLGIQNIELENSFEIYPNPTSNGLNIFSKTEGNLSIYNSLGQPFCKNIKIKKGENTFDLNLKPQIYFLILETNQTRISKKLIIK